MKFISRSFSMEEKFVEGYCKSCKTKQMVHRASWLVGKVPSCHTCQKPLEPTKEAMKQVRSRVREIIKMPLHDK